jgi:glucokinase
MVKKHVIGVDIGGTKIAAGIVSGDGKLEKSLIMPTLANKGMDVSLGQVYKTIDKLLLDANRQKKKIVGIGLCAPGPLDPIKGIVHNPPNLPGWSDVPITGLIKKRYRIKTKLENDANAAGIAEMLWGNAQGYKNIFYVTVSTGIGTAVIINGKIYHGKNGMAGEGGHVTIKYDSGEICGCGLPGCIEVLASGSHTERRIRRSLKRRSKKASALLRLAGNKADRVTMSMVAKAARAGDEYAGSIIKEQGKLLGVWLGNMISILDPQIIVIGGGVSMMGEMLFKEIRGSAYAHTINKSAVETPIVQTKLKKHVGVFGAASIIGI